RRTLRLRPALRVAAHRVIAAFVAEPAKLLEDADDCQTLALRLHAVGAQEPVELSAPGIDPRLRLTLPLVAKHRLAGTKYLAHRVARHMQLAADPLHRPTLNVKGAAHPGNRIH